MGVGKTTFSKALCEVLQVQDVVSSPTFSIVNEYLSDQNGTIFHFDFYRLNDEKEAFDMGYEDYFYSDTYCLVEWPEKVENILPSSFANVQIKLHNGERFIKIKQMSNLSSLGKEGYLPQEEMLEVGRKKSSLFIGLPKKRVLQENRIAIVPDAVQLLVSSGHEIWVESGAGDNANFTDNEYSEAGAKIVYDTKEVYQADIIMKVEPPTLEEIEMMKGRQTLISALQITTQSKVYRTNTH